MLGTTKASAFRFPRTTFVGCDTSLFGTLGVLAASVGVLLTAYLGG